MCLTSEYCSRTMMVLVSMIIFYVTLVNNQIQDLKSLLTSYLVHLRWNDPLKRDITSVENNSLTLFL